VSLNEEDLMLLELLERKQRITSYGDKNNDWVCILPHLLARDNIATYADSIKEIHGTHALIVVPTTRSRAWIVDYVASQHVTGVFGEFSSYTHLTFSENIQTTDVYDSVCGW
jgi:hypothetical protein